MSALDVGRLVREKVYAPDAESLCFECLKVFEQEENKMTNTGKKVRDSMVKTPQDVLTGDIVEFLAFTFLLNGIVKKEHIEESILRAAVAPRLMRMKKEMRMDFMFGFFYEAWPCRIHHSLSR